MTFGYCKGNHDLSKHIWGSGPYTCNTDPCSAAVHSGAISKAAGGFYSTI